MPKIRLLAALSLACLCAPGGAHDSAQAKYLGNEGVMVTRGATKVLFDAFYAESFGGQYHLVPTAIETAMLSGTAPFDGVDAVFITHIHPDHFNSRKTIAYLRAHPNVRLYAGLDVISAIYAADVGIDDPIMKRVTRVNLAPGAPPAKFSVDGVEVEAFHIPHNGQSPLPHFAYRVTLDRATTVMHLGDADPADSHYAPYQSAFDAKKTHVAFVPVWLLTDAGGRRVLEQRIRPAKMIGIHAEAKDEARAEDAKRDAGADVFTRPGETRVIED